MRESDVTLVKFLPAETTSSLYRSMMVISCLRTSCGTVARGDRLCERSAAESKAGRRGREQDNRATAHRKSSETGLSGRQRCGKRLACCGRGGGRTCARRIDRAWMKFSKHHGLENFEVFQPCARHRSTSACHSECNTHPAWCVDGASEDHPARQGVAHEPPALLDWRARSRRARAGQASW